MQALWASKSQFRYPKACPLLEWDQCFDRAREIIEQTGDAVLLGDFGDNLCAGASGDVPFVTRKLVTHFAKQTAQTSVPVLVAGLVDPNAVNTCSNAGVGSVINSLPVGAALTMACGCAEHLYGEQAAPFELRDVLVCGVVAVGTGRWAIIKALTLPCCCRRILGLSLRRGILLACLMSFSHNAFQWSFSSSAST